MRIALALTVVLLFAIVLLTVVLHGVHRSDFTGYYTSGLILHQGNAPKLYDISEQARIQRQLFNREDLLINPHPPFEAIWFAALARYSCVRAYILWGIINILLWLYFQELLRRYTPIPQNSFHYLWLCSLFVPLWVTLMQGQTTLLLLVLFSATFAGMKRGQDFNAGFFLGLGLFKFPIVFPFALICFFRSKWKLIAGCFTAGTLWGVVSVITVGPAGLRSYANLLLDIARHPERPAYANMRAWEKMPTLKGLFTVLFAGRLATMHIGLLVAAASACLVLFTAWRWRQADHDPGGKSQGLMFAAALTVAQVTSPHLYIHDLTLMLLAVLLVIGSPQWSVKSSQRMVLLAAIVILYTPPIYLLLLRWQVMYTLAVVLVVFALGAISLARKAEPPLT